MTWDLPMIESAGAGWGCIVVAIGLIVKHAFMSPKNKCFPSAPTYERVLVGICAVTFFIRGQEILLALGTPTGTVPITGVIATVSLGLLYLNEALKAYWQHTNERDVEALQSIQKIVANGEPGTLGQVIKLGSMATLKERGMTVSGND